MMYEEKKISDDVEVSRRTSQGSFQIIRLVHDTK